MTDNEFHSYLERLAEDLAEAGNEFTSQDVYEARLRMGALMYENEKLKHLNKHLQRLTEPHVTLGAKR